VGVNRPTATPTSTATPAVPTRVGVNRSPRCYSPPCFWLSPHAWG